MTYYLYHREKAGRLVYDDASFEEYAPADEAAEVSQSILSHRQSPPEVIDKPPGKLTYAFRYLLLEDGQEVLCLTHKDQAEAYRKPGQTLVKTHARYSPLSADIPPHDIIGTFTYAWTSVSGIGATMADRLDALCEAEHFSQPADLFVHRDRIENIKGMGEATVNRLFDELGMVVDWQTWVDKEEAHALHRACGDIDTIEALLETDIPPQAVRPQLELEVFL